MYLLEGNMGVGKSTFLKLIKKHIPEMQIHFEPYKEWSDDKGGESLLGNYFDNPGRWEYTASTYIMLCRVRDYVEVQKNSDPNIVMERSIYSGHFCYARSGYAAGNYKDVEWELYNRLAHFMIQSKCRPPLGFIYLKACAKTCYERISKRSRASEDLAPFSFVEQIGKWHDSFLLEKEDIFPEIQHVPVLVLDAEKDFISDNCVIQEYMDKVWHFVRKTQIMPSKRARSLPESWLFKEEKQQNL